VRAAGGKLIADFVNRGMVAIGFTLPEDMTGLNDWDAFLKVVRRVNPGRSEQSIGQRCGIVWRFVREIAVGDQVLTYDPTAREYVVGVVKGSCEYSSTPVVRDMTHFRSVEWKGRVHRSKLSFAAQRELGSMQTVFSLNDTTAAEFSALLTGSPVPERPPPSASESTDLPIADDDAEAVTVLRDQMVERAREMVTSRVDRLTWEEMQELVAGILRAMGYKTRISPRGPDRGRDIVASPDGLGLEQPRIVVEVKHRQGAIGAPALRGFVGGLQSSDRGLYVSTGGFAREARYEADRASCPITLIDLDELVSLLLEHYDETDPRTRALVPLVPIYWPAS
jgi:restriction system protein